MKNMIANFLNSMSRAEAFSWIARNTTSNHMEDVVWFIGDGFNVKYSRDFKRFIVW